MAQNKHVGRKSQKTARMPAMKFAHLRKKMQKRGTGAGKKG